MASARYPLYQLGSADEAFTAAAGPLGVGLVAQMALSRYACRFSDKRDIAAGGMQGQGSVDDMPPWPGPKGA